MAYYIFNAIDGDVSQATEILRSATWPVDAQEPHRDALAPGDHALVYVAAPTRMFIGRAELASAVRDWTPAELSARPRGARHGVALAFVEEWDPPVPMHAVLARIDTSAGARADFADGVVQITEEEYLTALAIAAGRGGPGREVADGT